MARFKMRETVTNGQSVSESTIGGDPIQFLLKFSSDDIPIFLGISFSSATRTRVIGQDRSGRTREMMFEKMIDRDHFYDNPFVLFISSIIDLPR
jgi:hypothetical protein